MESSSEALRCVSCNVLNPTDGKLLHCLHVICGACLSDSIYHPGCVKCMLCRHVTNFRHSVAPVKKQLANVTSLLGVTDTGEAKASAAGTGGGDALSSRQEG